MNVQIITSSYPQDPDDPSGTAGLFIRDFALRLLKEGHKVVMQPVARKSFYQSDPGLILEPIPWSGGDRELASINFRDPRQWGIILQLFIQGRKSCLLVHQKYLIDRTICMWAVPAGVFGYYLHQKTGKPYDVWALGSDIWAVRRIPFFGAWLLKKVLRSADHVYADGLQLCRDVVQISGCPCSFLPSSRKLPSPLPGLPRLEPADRMHLLFTGRYHHNKGPDLLLKAMAQLPQKVRASVFLHMFGIGPMESGLKDILRGLHLEDCVALHGPIGAQDLANYLSRMSFLVIPSRIESIPVIFSDAMQMGTPVISTPVGDLTEQICKYKCGIVCRDTAPLSIARGIERAVKNGAEDFREGTSQVLKQFDFQYPV